MFYNLAHDPDLETQWSSRIAALRKRGIEFISFTNEKRRVHINPHLTSTPLGKSRFVEKTENGVQSPSPDLTARFLKAVDIALIDQFLSAPSSSNINVHALIEHFSSKLIGLNSWMEKSSKFFKNGERDRSKIFSYPFPSPFKIDVHEFCIVPEKDIPLIESISIIGHVRTRSSAAWDMGVTEAIEYPDQLMAGTVYPRSSSQENIVRLITLKEAWKLADIGNAIIDLQDAFHRGGLPEFAKGAENTCQMVAQGNDIIETYQKNHAEILSVA